MDIQRIGKNFIENPNGGNGHYYDAVCRDFLELKEKYPFSYLTFPPTVEPCLATIKLFALNRELINITKATEEDLVNSYSRELWIDIPVDYRNKGCEVYGAKWIDPSRIDNADRHFYELDARKGYKLCIGVPDSFINMDNVILENVRTADHILTAYADYLSGRESSVIIKAYSHGKVGINEYRKENKRYYNIEEIQD